LPGVGQPACEDGGVTTLGHCEVRITCGSREEAAGIADALVEGRLVACAHLVPISSVYEWKQVVEHDDEVLITAATRVDRFDAIVETVRSLHSYELPAITAVALDGSHDYLDWIDGQTRR
jgi:periplasmic divalent cation tolerance protein